MGVPQEEVAYGEIRRFARHDLHVHVALGTASAFFTGLTDNLSEGGLFVATEAELSSGDAVSVALSVQALGVEHVECVVRWVRPAAPGVPRGYGLEFVRISERLRAGIQGAIDLGALETLFIDLEDDRP